MSDIIATSEFECVRYVVSDHVAHVTLARPEVHNALNRRAYSELESSFVHIAEDLDVRCVVVTGQDPSFCSGDDVKQLMAGPERETSTSRLARVRPEPTPAALSVMHCDRPVIAAVNGAAMGWGMELALFADIRVASERARFGELFIKRGLIADLGGIYRLPRVVGPAKAAELLFTGDVINAEEAERIGLVSQVVPHDSLLTEAEALAARIAANPPLALRHMKDGLRRSVTTSDVDELGSWVSATLGKLFETEDHREGVASFLEKRVPVFKGR